jgi:hypothetical protein
MITVLKPDLVEISVEVHNSLFALVTAGELSFGGFGLFISLCERPYLWGWSVEKITAEVGPAETVENIAALLDELVEIGLIGRS